MRFRCDCVAYCLSEPELIAEGLRQEPFGSLPKVVIDSQSPGSASVITTESKVRHVEGVDYRPFIAQVLSFECDSPPIIGASIGEGRVVGRQVI